MSDKPQSGSFWDTSLGLLTKITGFITAVALLIGTLNQAGIINLPKPTSTPTSVMSPSPLTSPSPTPRFQDDFSSTSNNWPRGPIGGRGSANFVSGTYRLTVMQPNSYIFASPGSLKFNDPIIEVDATKIAGADSNYFGVICREDDQEGVLISGYSVLINSKGEYNIFKGTPVVSNSLLEKNTWQNSDAIRRGKATNQLRVECIENRLALSINGEKVDEVYDSDFRSGNISLIAGTYDMPSAAIAFDNVVVLKP